MGWPEILQAVNRRRNSAAQLSGEDGHRHIRKFHDHFPSPIVFGGKGGSPSAVLEEVDAWLDRVRQQYGRVEQARE